MPQHYGSLRNPETQASKLYALLVSRRGQWCESWELNKTVESAALHSVVSEVRAQIRPGEDIEHKKKRCGRRYRGWYRLVGKADPETHREPAKPIGSGGQGDMFPRWDT